jgi:hypothetical protein
MKQLNRLFHLITLNHRGKAFLTCVAVLAGIALSSSIQHTRAQDAQITANGNPAALRAEVLDLLSAYHGALAYGGDIDAMGNLWADNGSLTLNNGTPFVGKAAVLGFFQSTGYFSHNWVSLAPEWKITVTVQGNIAYATTECIATDVSVSPNVVKGQIQVNAICQKLNGKWFFIQMNNFSQPQI